MSKEVFITNRINEQFPGFLDVPPGVDCKLSLTEEQLFQLMEDAWEDGREQEQRFMQRLIERNVSR